ncbi:MAG: FixH family protein [Sulfuricurvum sp.]|uniref:FixH family protein n=1 Tax=Sulfuricurvum sp. TaxID=2025608 RepID=UPI00262E1FD0|nr:FixH family protein [Sulfuricurvum sp.]MDD5159796.1 FixH family protein [Sulfuricurvum sp.]
MFKNPGTKWPIIIALSIAGVIGMSVVTIKIASSHPVEMSNYEMLSYHDYDHGVNDIIEAKIAFDKKYSIVFLTPQILEKGTVIEYKITDKSGNAVNNAKIEAVLTRPDLNKFDVNLTNPSISEGKYTFNPVDLPKVGRWDILTKVTVGSDKRFFNLKADTRNPDTLEF